MSRDAAVRRIVALHAPGLLAEILNMRALRYGTDPGSASAIRRHGSRLIVKQDDVNALAVIDASACIMPLLLPPGADGRRSFDDTIGNRHLKMDLEAAVVLPEARVMDVVEPDGCAIALKLEGIEPMARIEPCRLGGFVIPVRQRPALALVTPSRTPMMRAFPRSIRPEAHGKSAASRPARHHRGHHRVPADLEHRDTC